MHEPRANGAEVCRSHAEESHFMQAAFSDLDYRDSNRQAAGLPGNGAAGLRPLLRAFGRYLLPLAAIPSLPTRR